MKKFSILLLSGLALFSSSWAFSKTAPATPAQSAVYTGRVYSPESDPSKRKLLFNFRREGKIEGNQEKIVRTYTTPDGKTVVHEDILYVDGKLKKLELKQNQVGESGTVEIKGDKIHFEYVDSDKDKDTDEETYEANTLIADQVMTYLHKNWATIEKGDDVSIRYAVPDRKETVGFKYFKSGEEKVEGVDCVKVTMKPSSFVIAALVKPLTFYIEKAEKHRLVRLDGRTPPKVQKDGKWKDYDAISVYDLN